MWDAIKKTIIGLLGSKKVMVAVLGGMATVIVSLSATLGLDVPAEQAEQLATKLMGIVATLIGGIAFQDFGKEKARIEANGKTPDGA